MRRKVTLLLFVLAFAVLGGVLLSVKEGRQLRLSFGAPRVQQPPKNATLKISASTVASATATSVLEEPRYTGRDAAGRTWEVTAAYATQSATVSGSELLLTTVSATLVDAPGNQALTLSAPTGRFNSASQTLNLTGGVTGCLE